MLLFIIINYYKVYIMDMALATQNLSNALNDGLLKTKLLNTLNTLHQHNNIATEAADISQQKARNENKKSFFKKAGGLVIGGGLIALGGGLALSGVAPAIGAVMGLAAAFPYFKSVDSLMSPNPKFHKEERNAHLAKEDAKVSKEFFSSITLLANDFLTSKQNQNPDAGVKLKSLIEGMKKVENHSAFFNATIHKEILDRQKKGPSMIERFKSRIKALNSDETDIRSENKFKLK